MARSRSFDAKVIEVTDGNIRNDHIYLRDALNLIPEDAIGGTNSTRTGTPITVRFVPGATVVTDIPEDKLFLRCRSEVGDFFRQASVAGGDYVIFTRVAEREFEIRRVT